MVQWELMFRPSEAGSPLILKFNKCIWCGPVAESPSQSQLSRQGQIVGEFLVEGDYTLSFQRPAQGGSQNKNYTIKNGKKLASSDMINATPPTELVMKSCSCKVTGRNAVTEYAHWQEVGFEAISDYLFSSIVRFSCYKQHILKAFVAIAFT